jgi:hypothetical protein
VSAARDASFRQIVRNSFNAVDGRRSAASQIAEAILAELHERGLAIHDVENCIRRPWQDREKGAGAVRTGVEAPETIGREMTLDEQIAVGMVAVSDDTP